MQNKNKGHKHRSANVWPVSWPAGLNPLDLYLWVPLKTIWFYCRHLRSTFWTFIMNFWVDIAHNPAISNRCVITYFRTEKVSGICWCGIFYCFGVRNLPLSGKNYFWNTQNILCIHANCHFEGLLHHLSSNLLYFVG